MRRNERGFTMLEIFVALGVFALGLAGVIALQLASVKTARNAKDISLSSNLASDQLERLRVADYDTIFDSVRLFDGFGVELVAAPAYFTVTTTITTATDGTYKDAFVVVTWQYGPADILHMIRMQSRLIP